MITAVNYLGTVNRVRDDIQDASETSDALGTGLDKLEEFLEVPGKLEQKLRVPESALDLPAAVIVPLSFAPGIGTAVKTIDRIAEETSEEIERQADAMEALDDAWAPLRNLVDVAQAANDVAGPALTGFSVEHVFRQDEALLLSASLGNQTIYGGSKLAARITDYTDVAETWFATQAALLAPVRAASTALDTAVAQLATVFDGLGFIDNALDEANAVFAPIAKSLSDLEDLLCVVAEVTPEIVVPPVVITPEIVVPPVIVFGQVIVPGFTIPAVITPGFTIPALIVDVCAILETLGQQADIVISFVEGLVSDALSVIGVDLGGIADDLRDLLLTPLQPVFDALADLTSLVDPLIDTVSGLVDDLGASLDEIVEDLRDVVDLGSLFENREEGDAGGEAVDDVITGTDGEDALFGLDGADTLSGANGGDFVFGGLGGDVLTGDNGNDELYGGVGNDSLKGGANNDLLDGGLGRDTLEGGSGNDIVIGGGGFDILLGGSGADSFVIMPGSGLEIIADFADDVDSVLIDAEMVAGAEAGDDPTAVSGASLTNGAFINLDGGFVYLAGVRFDDIVDDIVLV